LPINAFRSRIEYDLAASNFTSPLAQLKAREIARKIIVKRL
jgi:hypothetical protein